MIELVLKGIILFLAAGIVFYLFKITCLVLHDYIFPHWYANSKRKRHRQELPAEIIKRATDSFAKVNNGEIKLEGLGNEADPHKEENSVISFKDTLTKPKLIDMIKNVKEVDYYEQN